MESNKLLWYRINILHLQLAECQSLEVLSDLKASSKDSTSNTEIKIIYALNFELSKDFQLSIITMLVRKYRQLKKII